MNELYDRTCRECKKNFKSEQRCKHPCPECDTKHRKQTLQQKNKSVKAIKIKPAKKVKKPAYTISQICSIQEIYNKEHKTYHSYGEIVKLIEEGVIK